MTDRNKKFVDRVLAGYVYVANPSDHIINRASFDITRYAATMESTRHRGFEADPDSVLLGISKMRGALDAMEKWAKMEKPE